MQAKYPGGVPGSTWGATLAPLAVEETYAYLGSVFGINYPRNWEVLVGAASEVIVGSDDPQAACWLHFDEPGRW